MPRSRKQCVQERGLDLQRYPHLHFLPILTACKPSSLLQSCLGCSVVNGLSYQPALKPGRVRSHHTSSSASPAIGVLTWGPESPWPTALNPADPRQSSDKPSIALSGKQEDGLFPGPQSLSCLCNKMALTRKS